MRYKIYKTSEEAWGGMLEAIKSAKKSIYWESYILSEETHPDFDFISSLLERAKAGVKIKIIEDGVGNYFFGETGISNKTKKELALAGVEILTFNRWFHRIHRKILIVDEKIAFIGGVNVSPLHRKWMDLHIKFQSRSLSRSLLHSFAHTYFYTGGHDEYLLSFRKKSPVRMAQLWVLDHIPSAGIFLLNKYYKEKIAMAKKRIIFATPSFTPSRWLIRSLEIAQARGVSVEILVPKRADSRIEDFFNYLFMASVGKSGIKFYLTKEMLHAKAILVDDSEGMIGSGNLDILSFDFNEESSISFRRPEMVKELARTFEEWKAGAVPFDDARHHRGFLHRALEWIAKKVFNLFF